MTEAYNGGDQSQPTTIATFSRGELTRFENHWRQFRRGHPEGTPIQALARVPRGEAREQLALGLHSLKVIERRGMSVAGVAGVLISQTGSDLSTRSVHIILPEPGMPYGR